MPMNKQKNSEIPRMIYNFNQISDTETEVEIYDRIAGKKSYDWWTDEEGTEVTPNDFKADLNNCGTQNITIRINSGGGEVSAANVISVAIQEAIAAGKNINCKIDGMCASAAVQIALSCNEVVIHESAVMMVHDPLMFMYGYSNIESLEKDLESLKAFKNAILNTYERKTGKNRQELADMMTAETWMDGKEAVEKGFADKLMFDEEGAAQNVINRVFNVCNTANLNIPDKFRASATNQINLTKGEEVMAINSVADLQAQFPEFMNQYKAEIENSAKEAGVEAERARIKAIDEMQGKVHADLLNKAKYETFETAETVAMNAIKENALIQNGILEAMKNETDPANAVNGAVNNGPIETPADEKNATKEKASNAALNYFKSIGKVAE